MADRTGRRPTSARIALPSSPASVGTARRFIEARTAAWSFPEPAGAQLVLIGSELVTNAILHARTELTLTLELLERADALCRAGVLLTPEPPPEVKGLRRWFVEEMVAQL